MTALELRCTCSARPLLAIARPTSNGQVVLHIRIYKRKQLYGEIIAEDGLVRIRCRTCLRWYAVRIRHERVSHRAEDLPAVIRLPDLREIS